jgi:hypothetical protein
MNGEITISLIVIIVAAVIILRFVARVFIKLILIIILAALAMYMFIQGGLF